MDDPVMSHLSPRFASQVQPSPAPKLRKSHDWERKGGHGSKRFDRSYIDAPQNIGLPEHRNALVYPGAERAVSRSKPTERFTCRCHFRPRRRRLPAMLNGMRSVQRWCGPQLTCQGRPNGSANSHNLRPPAPQRREARTTSACGSFLAPFGIALSAPPRPCRGLQLLSLQPILQGSILPHPVVLPQLIGPTPEQVFLVCLVGRHVGHRSQLRDRNGVMRCRLRRRSWFQPRWSGNNSLPIPATFWKTSLCRAHRSPRHLGGLPIGGNRPSIGEGASLTTWGLLNQFRIELESLHFRRRSVSFSRVLESPRLAIYPHKVADSGHAQRTAPQRYRRRRSAVRSLRIPSDCGQ
jgi:hypothetical protein